MNIIYLVSKYPLLWCQAFSAKDVYSKVMYCRGPAVAPASAQVEVPNSQRISCLDGSFLECSLHKREARVRSPAGKYQSWDF
jgi:hypothetical protein